MKAIKTVGIKNLKNHLSAYLREVKTGTRVLITDRGNVIAELHKPATEPGLLMEKSILSEWVEDGKLILPKSKKTVCPASPIKIKIGTAQNLLDEERGE